MVFQSKELRNHARLYMRMSCVSGCFFFPVPVCVVYFFVSSSSACSTPSSLTHSRPSAGELQIRIIIAADICVSLLAYFKNKKEY